VHRHIRLFLLLGVLCAAGAQAAGDSALIRTDTRAYDPAAAEQTLLVTFPDRGLNRVAVGSRSSRYAARGKYDNTTWAVRVARQIAADHKLEMITQWPVTELGVRCVVYYVPSGQAVEERKLALAHDKRVAHVQRMGVFKTLGVASTDPYYSLQHQLKAMHIEELHRRSTGEGVRIAVIDTGINMAHPDLDGQFLDDNNFVYDFSPSFEADRHGTAVAGIIGAKSGNGAGIVGIATDAKMLAYKACWQTDENGVEATCNSFTLALAINRAISMHAQVINLSLTGPADPLLELLIKRAIDQGIVVVAADDSTSDTVSDFPASVPHVIAVRNSASVAPDTRLKANVVTMPGTEVLTTMPEGTYDFLSGSSFSAASVSGLAALALQLEPASTSTKIISALRHSGAGYSSDMLNQFESL